jgi:ABC-type multidrug transport system fused ATPase/permease subunit
LDSHVAENVHKKVVCGILKGKSRVVVTNRLEFISSCDLMIVLKDGRVESMGTYNELRHSSLALQDLLRAWDESQSNQTDVQPESSLQRTISNISNKSRNSNLQRTISNTSRNSEGSQEGEDTANDNHEEPEQEEEEARATGNLKKEVILFYVHNMGGYMVFLMLSLLYLGTEALNQVGFIWLSNWTSHPRVGNEQAFYLGVYVSLSMGGVLMGFAVSIITYVAGFRAATRLHDEMFTSVLRSPMLFFQQTPHGRIINRFSKDTSEVDRGVVGTLLAWFSSL